MIRHRDNLTASIHLSAGPAWQIGRVVLIVSLLWIVSSQGYYALVDAFGLGSGYNDAPVLFAAYYLGWTGITLLTFRDLLVERLTSETILRETLVMVPILTACGLFVVFFLPTLPEVSVLRAPADPPEFMFASAWYYLPKSADILFQQTAVAALILTAARAGFGLVQIAAGMAVAFGGFHLLLAFDGFTPIYVTRFTLSATLFGALLPYLYLRAKGGFRWAYGLHWGFYAVDAALTHLILAVPPWAQT
jgi:hypothetical protein